MSVLYRPNYRPKTPWRVTVIHAGQRREGCYETEADANKAMKYWQERLESEYGPMQKKCAIPGCKLPYHAKGYCDFHYRRNQRYGDPLHESGLPGRPRKEPQGPTVIAPCGGRMRGTPGPRRCKMHLQCPVDRYDKCLMVAIKHNWLGWVVG